MTVETPNVERGFRASAVPEATRAKRRLQIDPQRIVDSALAKLKQSGTPAPAGNLTREQRLLKIAARYKGVPYLWGGTTTRGLDCSGYTQLVFRQMGINLLRTSRMQATQGRRVSNLRSARPGDLLFYASNGTIHHVGIYAGNGMYWNAPRRGTVVSLRRVGVPYLIKRLL